MKNLETLEELLKALDSGAFEEIEVDLPRAFELLSSALTLDALTARQIEHIPPLMLTLAERAEVSLPVSRLRRDMLLAMLDDEEGTPLCVREGAYALLFYAVEGLDDLLSPALRVSLSGPWLRPQLRRGDALADACIASLERDARAAGVGAEFDEALARAQADIEEE